ncbi:hypothetical protein, partial [Deinococcus pimensis]|uniref:hypothetical protein n=1 Tax=Deinococcus pimensis TaxID=309888 RepID=UPI0005EBEFA6
MNRRNETALPFNPFALAEFATTLRGEVRLVDDTCEAEGAVVVARPLDEAGVGVVTAFARRAGVGVRIL